MQVENTHGGERDSMEAEPQRGKDAVVPGFCVIFWNDSTPIVP